MILFLFAQEATEILVKQLEQLYTEDKLLREFLPDTDLGLNPACHWGAKFNIRALPASGDRSILQPIM